MEDTRKDDRLKKLEEEQLAEHIQTFREAIEKVDINRPTVYIKISVNAGAMHKVDVETFYTLQPLIKKANPVELEKKEGIRDIVHGAKDKDSKEDAGSRKTAKGESQAPPSMGRSLNIHPNNNEKPRSRTPPQGKHTPSSNFSQTLRNPSNNNEKLRAQHPSPKKCQTPPTSGRQANIDERRSSLNEQKEDNIHSAEDNPKSAERDKRVPTDTKKENKISEDRAVELKENEREIKRLKRETMDEQERCKHFKERCASLENENVSVKETLEKTKSENESLKKEVMQIQHISEKRTEENITLKNKIEQIGSNLQAKEKTITELTKDRDAIRDRFVRLAGSKLTDQNSDVADLSDPYRADKLSDMFSQLYSKEWTLASIAFTKKNKEENFKKEVHIRLMNILKKCFERCKSLNEVQVDMLKNVLFHPNQDMEKDLGAVQKGKKYDFTKDDGMAILALRKSFAVKDAVRDKIREVVSKEVKSESNEDNDKCIKYIQKCVDICWLMVVHTPPLFIQWDTKSGDKFDTDLYNVYQGKGSVIDYVLWPPLFIEESGALLRPGVAQVKEV